MFKVISNTVIRTQPLLSGLTHTVPVGLTCVQPAVCHPSAPEPETEPRPSLNHLLVLDQRGAAGGIQQQFLTPIALLSFAVLSA